MKIYTRGGDGGETGLFGGGRVSKSHARVEAFGTVDELNASLGVAEGTVDDDWIRERLRQLQHDLFNLGSSLATPGAADGGARPATPSLPNHRVPEMEGWIDAATEETPPLTAFILPGGSPGAAALHLARTVCRRAERAVVRLYLEEPVEDGVLQYLNRVSDLLFALARMENHRAGVPDVLWEQGGSE
jgi:cob(I)alamin adenosyltransferase